MICPVSAPKLGYSSFVHRRRNVANLFYGVEVGNKWDSDPVGAIDFVIAADNNA